MNENEKKQQESALTLAKAVVEALNAKKAVEVKTLAVASKTVLADYFVVATGTSSTHIRTLADEMNDYFSCGHTPKVKQGNHCNACSLKGLCLPVFCVRFAILRCGMPRSWRGQRGRTMPARPPPLWMRPRALPHLASFLRILPPAQQVSAHSRNPERGGRRISLPLRPAQQPTPCRDAQAPR